MPIYEYQCNDCGAISEFLVGSNPQTESLTCKKCGSPHLEKVISVPNSLKSPARTAGHTCCGREERCSTPPCHTGGGCRHD